MYLSSKILHLASAVQLNWFSKINLKAYSGHTQTDIYKLLNNLKYKNSFDLLWKMTLNLTKDLGVVIAARAVTHHILDLLKSRNFKFLKFQVILKVLINM